MSAVRTSLRSALTAGLLGGALLAVPAQANAAGQARDHCVSNLSTGETACFGTFRDAVAHGAAADRALTAKLTGPQTSATGQAAAYALSTTGSRPSAGTTPATSTTTSTRSRTAA